LLRQSLLQAIHESGDRLRLIAGRTEVCDEL
jgi:hypothetical protein